MIRVRPASKADATRLAQLDATYTAGERALALERSGDAPELSFALRWRSGTAREENYGSFDEERVRGALALTDLFLVAEDGETVAGVLMVVVPTWTDAGEITDLVVDRGARRSGVGRTLVESATSWARQRELRGLWVEPGADNGGAIAFYLSLGFRVAGFNDRWNAVDTDERPTVFMYRELR